MKIKNCILIEAFKCNKNSSVVDVAKKFKGITLKHMFVVDENDYPIGIISITDINNRVVAEGKDPKKLIAKDIMSSPVAVADINDDLGEIYEKMVKKHTVMEPVVKENKMVGIITIHQIVKNLNNNS
ncbi:MAG: CBS domain-containing protein [Candidatus Pacearchaeota archaeon]|jgi:signal-transduction protein with cAMP-binding, CBS, and nucleotidyltransferase domain